MASIIITIGQPQHACSAPLLQVYCVVYGTGGPTLKLRQKM